MEFKFFYIVLHCVSFAVLVVSDCRVKSECRNTTYGRECTLPSAPERTALIGNQLFVGVADDILAYHLDSLEVGDCVNLAVGQEREEYCVEQQGHHPDDCKNFVRVIQPISESAANAASNPALQSKILVCGTGAFTPKCTLHASADLSNYTNMTNSSGADHGFCPFTNTVPNVEVLATNGRFFSGTHFQQFGTHRTIGMAPKPLQRNNTFTVKTPKADPLWLNQPDFVSAFEIGDYVYFFARELAYETTVDAGTSVVYSRAFRVCKNDPGLTSEGSFLTFQKARMKCTRSGQRNSIPYNYDNLKSTFLWKSEETAEPILYGAFSSPVNGPEGAAICKFSFDENIENSLSHVFNDGQYISQSEPGNPIEYGEQFTCPGTDGPQRTEEEARMYQLVASSAIPLEPQPLHSVSGSEFTQLAVDVIEYQGQKQEILYYSLSNGKLGQCIITESGQKYEHIIHDQGQSIHHLAIHKGVESHYLLATTDDSVMSIPLGNCARYSNCWACMDAKDPYCAWDGEACISKFATTSSNSINETFSITETTAIQLCGSRPEEPSPTQPPTLPICPSLSTSEQGSTSTQQPQPNPTTTSPAETSSSSLKCISPSKSDGPPKETVTVYVETGAVTSSSSKGKFSVIELVGATLGGFVFGLPVGLIICAFFFTVFIKKRTHHVKERRSQDIEHQPGVLRQVNNQLDLNARRKEQSLHNHYVDGPITTVDSAPTAPEKKNINEYVIEEDDDVLTDLPPVPPKSLANGRGAPPKVLQKPKMSGRGRTDSTRALMSSLSSEPSSESPGTTPLDSPT